VLWQNERRRARLDALIVYGRSEVKAVSAHDKLNPKNRGSLVHVSGGSTVAKEPIKDPWFRDVEVRTNCVRLRTEVELCQWVAEPRKANKDQRVPKFTYKSQWASSWHHSDMFCDKTKKNKIPPGLTLGTNTTRCSRVEYGSFVLPPCLVERCQNFEFADHLLGPTVTSQENNYVFHQHTDHYYYVRPGSNTKPQEIADNPQIGDARVRFSYVPESRATILALQVDSKGGADTFAPYRVIPRSLFGMPKDLQSGRLLMESKKSRSELSRQDNCGGMICCVCNMVNFCCTGLLSPEIYHLFQGTKEPKECFAAVTHENPLIVWFVRLVCWLILYAGFFLSLGPVTPLLMHIPLFGVLDHWGVWIAAALATLSAAILLIFISHTRYRPMMGVFWLVMLVIILVGCAFLSHELSRPFVQYAHDTFFKE